jgi:hypothetical protein
MPRSIMTTCLSQDFPLRDRYCREPGVKNKCKIIVNSVFFVETSIFVAIAQNREGLSTGVRFQGVFAYLHGWYILCIVTGWLNKRMSNLLRPLILLTQFRERIPAQDTTSSDFQAGKAGIRAYANTLKQGPFGIVTLHIGLGCPTRCSKIASSDSMVRDSIDALIIHRTGILTAKL